MRKSAVNVLLGLVLVAVVAVSFVIGGQTSPDGRFAGTDATAVEQIQAANPGYQPWFTPFFQPASGEVEAGLFALQAGIGGTILGFAIVGLRRRRKAQAAPANPPTATEPVP
ncbi:MAG: energy-coupling factor ABC transporter substrate-binding protein [Propionicimonas sp.]